MIIATYMGNFNGIFLRWHEYMYMHANHDRMGQIGGDNVEVSFFQGGGSVGISPGSLPLPTKDVKER